MKIIIIFQIICQEFLFLTVSKIKMNENEKNCTTRRQSIKQIDTIQDSQAIKFRDSRTQQINMGALKTEIDRRIIKILRLLGESCKFKQKTFYNHEQYDNKQNLVQSQIDYKILGQLAKNQKVGSFFQPNDVTDQNQSSQDSNQSLTRKTIEEMSIYKIFGFKNGTSQNSNQLDDNFENIFHAENNQLTQQNRMIQTLKISTNLEDITNKRSKPSSHSQRKNYCIQQNQQCQGKVSDLSKKSNKNKQNMAKQKVGQQLFKDEKRNSLINKVSIKDLLEKNGLQTGQKISIVGSPVCRKEQASNSYRKKSISSIKKHAIKQSAEKQQITISHEVRVSDSTMETMKKYLGQHMQAKKMRKESVDNNVRISMLKRIENKCSNALKPFGYA